MRIEVGLPCQGSRPTSTDADAAAGGSWTRLPTDSLKGDARSTHAAPRGGCSVASAGLVELEKSLADSTQLQGRAMLAIDRIGKQQAALRRFPMACPSCGSLNTPSGLCWGAGDLVPCSDCNRTFVPLSNGLQDTDLLALRTAVKKLREQEEKVQYLEQIVSNQVPAGGSNCSASRTSLPDAGHHAASPVIAGSSTTRSTRGQPNGFSRVGEASKVPAVDVVASGNLAAGCEKLPQVFDMSTQSGEDDPLLAPEVSPASLHAAPDGVASPATVSDGSPCAVGTRLMPLLATQDLITGSSCSSSTPCFFGRRMQQRPSLDTEQQAREAMEMVKSGHGGVGLLTKAGRRSSFQSDREDGEITSDSESVKSWDVRCLKPPPLIGRGNRYPGSPSQTLPQRLPDRRLPTKEFATSQCNAKMEAVATSDALEWRMSKKMVILLFSVILVRACVRHFTSAINMSQAFASSLLCAMASFSAVLMFKASSEALAFGRLMETQTNLCHRSVNFGLDGPLWNLCTIEMTFEEAFGCTQAFVQLAICFFFESWGLNGPRRWRRAVVVLHASFIVAFNAASQVFLTKQASEKHVEGTVWMLIAASTGAIGMWAAFTWWPIAAGDSSCALDSDSTAGSPSWVHAPSVALVTVQLANMWTARRAKQPVLLGVFVMLAGMATAFSNHLAQADTQVKPSNIWWIPPSYLVFWATSACILWQELFKSL